MPDEKGNYTREELENISSFIERGQGASTIPLPPTAGAGDKFVKGFLKGGIDTVPAFLKFLTQAASSIGYGALEATPSVVFFGKENKEKVQKLAEFVETTPLDSKWREWLLTPPKTEGAMKVFDSVVNAVTDATGFRQGVTEHYNNYLSGMDPNTVIRGEYTPDLYREDNQVNLTKAFGVSPDAYLKAVMRTMSDVVFQASEAIEEGDFEQMGYLTGGIAAGTGAAMLTGPGRGFRKFITEATGLDKLDPKFRGVTTRTQLENLHLLVESQKNLDHLLEFDPKKIEAALGTEMIEVKDPALLIAGIAEMHPDLLAKVLRYANKEEVSISQAVSAVIEQGRVPGIEIQIEAARLGIEPDMAVTYWTDKLKELSDINKTTAGVFGSGLKAYSDIGESYKALRKQTDNPKDYVATRLEELKKKYNHDFEHAGSPRFLLWAKKNFDIVAKGALGAKVTSPLTTIRDTLSQVGMGVVDIFEKTIADGILSIDSITGPRVNRAALDHPDIYSSVAVDQFHGYMQTMLPSQRKVISQIIAELPAHSQKYFGSLHADATVANVSAGMGRNFAIGGRSMWEGTKEAVKGVATGGRKGQILAGTDLLLNDGIVRISTGLRSWLEGVQQNSFFAAKLYDELKRDGRYNTFEDYLGALREKSPDPKLVRMWEQAAKHAQERSMRLNPDVDAPWGKTASHVLQLYTDSPSLTLVLPDYPRFLYNKYDWMMRRRPTQFMSLFNEDFRKMLSSGEIDEVAFAKSARHSGYDLESPEYAEILKKAKSHAQREAAEMLGRSVTGAVQLMGGVLLQNSKLAGAKYYEVDLGTSEEPIIGKEKYDAMVENGLIDPPKNPNDRIILDLRAYDPVWVPYMAVGRFANVFRKTGSIDEATKHFTASEVADIIFGLRNLENSGFAVATILQRMTNPDSGGLFTAETGMQILDEEIMAPLTTVAKLMEIPLYLAGTEEGKDAELDPFSQPFGRTMQNIRPLMQMFGKDVPLQERKSLSVPGSLEQANKGFTLMTGMNLGSKSQLEQRITGAGLNMRQLLVGRSNTKQEEAERLDLMTGVLTTRMPNGTTLADTIARIDAIGEVNMFNERKTRKEIVAFRSDLLTGIFTTLRESISGAAKLQAFQKQPLLVFDDMKKGKSKLEQYYIDLMKKEALKQYSAPRSGLPSQ